MTPSIKPSSNWLALQKSLVQRGRPRKWLKVDRGEAGTSPDNSPAFPRKISTLPSGRRDLNSNEHVDLETTDVKNGESIAGLRRMVLGKVEHNPSQTAVGKYLALDCEMVGVGIEGNESSLARVSIVNYTGAIVLDVFVRQRERVVDYRTRWSGVRSTDLASSAKPFKEIQKTVAELIKDRILVGHAIYNDLKALLLSHPSPQLRDTQSLAYKYRVVKSRHPALRVLVKKELDIVIQGGEHSSVTDARATMALFRLHKKQWESGFRPFPHPQPNSKAGDDTGDKAVVSATPSSSQPTSLARGRKRKHSESSTSDDNDEKQVAKASTPLSSSQARLLSPSSTTRTKSPVQHISTLPPHRKQKSKPQPPARQAQQKGISSGISTVISRAGSGKEVRRNGKQAGDGSKKGVVGGTSKSGKKSDEWWKTLGGGKKGSIKM